MKIEIYLETLATSYEILADCSADETAADNKSFALSSLEHRMRNIN